MGRWTTRLGWSAIGWALLGLAGPAAAAGLSLHVLSSRPDMVSGGDALVEVRGATSGVRLTLNGRDVSNNLTLDEQSKTLRGLVAGLKVGPNTLAASAAAGKASLAVTNYPI